MLKQFEILQLAFQLAMDSLMKARSFNPDIAAASLLIFIRASRQNDEISAAQGVLTALDHLSALSREDHRSRIWQERKLSVQEAFEVLEDVYDRNASFEEYTRRMPERYSTPSQGHVAGI
ncbi:hypothetical protein [Mesorhizobium sp. YR577]|uniref:hypothetical protein n=1 Tax=Mesorhizobium sp. YR577 TaxID=1884373 RepID=UPI0008EDE5B6|nr:hypothetical protein [Mesorhizobium sp. YR577]SFU21698.1 hypothetical protein SAMN05518861_12846 [Mesorhizobium sp. YR577]